MKPIDEEGESHRALQRRVGARAKYCVVNR